MHTPRERFRIIRVFVNVKNMDTIDKDFINKLLEQAAANPRLRQNFDLRTSTSDTSQRMLNAMLPGTIVPIHRHPASTENVLLLHGRIVEVIYDNDGNELKRFCSIPQQAITVALYHRAHGIRLK